MTRVRLDPYALRCEYRTSPLGIGQRRPRLGWKLRSPERGQDQSAYRIRVAVDERALQQSTVEGSGLSWDSGWVTGRDHVAVEYAGAPLASSTRYHWRVDVRDIEGVEAGSETSWFETGLLADHEWVAKWIERDSRTAPVVEPPQDGDRSARTEHLAPPAQFRRSFGLTDTVTRARVYATAKGLYELRINGVRVGDGELTPGWTDYHHRIQYQSHDVTDLLRSGENVLAATLADGWWCGFVGFDARHQAQHYGKGPEFLAQLVVDHADGSRSVLGTDESWRESPGALQYSDLLMGEYHDAGGDLPGWDRPGFDDSTWNPARVTGSDTSLLVAELDEPVRVMGELPAREVTRRAGGSIVDFGQNMVGRVRLTVRGATRGQRIRLRHAEVLDSDGELYTANLRTAEATDVYLASGEEVEVFEPRYTFHGFRYVEVQGYPGELSAADIAGRVLHSDAEEVGEFHCSDPLVERLHDNIRWGQKGNFVSVPTDCPQRDERLGWLADAQVFLPTACFNNDLAAFYARWMRDVVDGQTAEGAFRDVAPVVSLEREAAPAWGDAGVIIPWRLYRIYGDRRVLERSFAAMTAWVDYVHRHNPDLIWRHAVGNHYGDWLQVGAQTPRDVLATAYFARSSAIVADAARVLGRPDEAAHYAALADDIRRVFRASFVDDDVRIDGDTQTGYLLALHGKLLSDVEEVRAVEHLAADITARGHHLTTGFVGVALLCPVLTEHDRGDLAYALLHQEEYPSWGYALRRGATTMWERWDGWTEERGFQSAAMNSFNHYSLGSVGEWLYRYVAGIDQATDSVGYRDLVIRPVPGGLLTWASARYDSVAGRIESSWRLRDGWLELEVAVPPGSEATVRVPTDDPGRVVEGELELERGAGVTVLTKATDHLTCHVLSGRYSFRSPYSGGTSTDESRDH